MKKRNVIILITAFSLIAPFASSCRALIISAPENMEDAKKMGRNAANVVREKMPNTIERTWNEEVLPIWGKMYEWAKNNIWETRLKLFFTNIWNKILRIFRQEVEMRKEDVKEEFQKEKQEIKQEAPEIGKTLWEKLKDLVK